MWVRRAAIRPVPLFAQVPEGVLGRVELDLSSDGEDAQLKLSAAFAKFEKNQPALSVRLSDELAKPHDETAIALGYFLSLAVWLAFDSAFGDAVATVSEVALSGVEEALTLDEQIRLSDPAEVVDSDDVIAMEQPHVLTFVNEHLDAALEANADAVDVNDVHRVYRVVLVQILALSYSVVPPANLGTSFNTEFSA